MYISIYIFRHQYNRDVIVLNEYVESVTYNKRYSILIYFFC